MGTEADNRVFTIAEFLRGDDRRRIGRPKKGLLTHATRRFIDAMATPGMARINAERIYQVQKWKTRNRNMPRRVNLGPRPEDMDYTDPGNGGRPIEGYPDVTAIQGYDEERFRKLQDRIAERKRLALKFTDITPEMVLGATAMRAFGSVQDAFDEETGEFSFPKAVESGAVHLIKKLKKRRDGSFEVEFYSNETAQQQLANYLGMENAPKANDDVPQLKSAVEATAMAIARAMHITDVDDQLRRTAWGRVQRWIHQSKAKYSATAMQELDRLYGTPPVETAVSQGAPSVHYLPGGEGDNGPVVETEVSDT